MNTHGVYPLALSYWLKIVSPICRDHSKTGSVLPVYFLLNVHNRGLPVWFSCDPVPLVSSPGFDGQHCAESSDRGISGKTRSFSTETARLAHKVPAPRALQDTAATKRLDRHGFLPTFPCKTTLKYFNNDPIMSFTRSSRTTERFHDISSATMKKFYEQNMTP
jgi:hypothetical protein